MLWERNNRGENEMKMKHGHLKNATQRQKEHKSCAFGGSGWKKMLFFSNFGNKLVPKEWIFCWPKKNGEKDENWQKVGFGELGPKMQDPHKGKMFPIRSAREGIHTHKKHKKMQILLKYKTKQTQNTKKMSLLGLGRSGSTNSSHPLNSPKLPCGRPSWTLEVGDPSAPNRGSPACLCLGHPPS